MIACYVRVSTQEQSLDRQVTACREYAVSQLAAEPGDLMMYRDKDTGTDTSRDGYEKLLTAAGSGEVSTLVVKSVSRLSRSVRDLDRTVDRLTGHGVDVHFVDEGLVMDPERSDPMQQAMFRLLGVFAELEADMIQQRTREGLAARMENDDYHHGRPPLGFNKDDGRLIESERYHSVCSVLEMVEKGELSKRKAAAELDCGRATIDRCLERADLYGL